MDAATLFFEMLYPILRFLRFLLCKGSSAWAWRLIIPLKHQQLALARTFASGIKFDQRAGHAYVLFGDVETSGHTVQKPPDDNFRLATQYTGVRSSHADIAHESR